MMLMIEKKSELGSSRLATPFHSTPAVHQCFVHRTLLFPHPIHVNSFILYDDDGLDKERRANIFLLMWMMSDNKVPKRIRLMNDRNNTHTCPVGLVGGLLSRGKGRKVGGHGVGHFYLYLLETIFLTANWTKFLDCVDYQPSFVAGGNMWHDIRMDG